MEEDQESALVACSLEEADLADRRAAGSNLQSAGVDVLTIENGLGRFMLMNEIFKEENWVGDARLERRDRDIAD